MPTTPNYGTTVPDLSVNCRGVGGSYDVEPLLRTWTDRIKIMGIDVGAMLNDNPRDELGPNLLHEAGKLSAVPSVGDKHPSSLYPDCCCSHIRITPFQTTDAEATDAVYVDVSWIQARNYPATLNGDGQSHRVRTIIFTPYQEQEIRNFDAYDMHTLVKYDPTNPKLKKMNVPKIADIRVSRTMYHMRITQFEDISNDDPGADFNQLLNSVDGGIRLPAYNTNDWMGFPSRTLAFNGRMVNYEGLPIARCEYNFTTNDRGYDKYISVYTRRDGYVEQDIVKTLPDGITDPSRPYSEFQDINGIGVFDMLDNFDFASFFPQIDVGRLR